MRVPHPLCYKLPILFVRKRYRHAVFLFKGHTYVVCSSQYFEMIVFVNKS